MVFQAFREVGGYPDSKPDLIHKGNWTAEAECFGPHLDFFQIFRDPITGDLPWPGIIFSVSTLSLYYWCTDQVTRHGTVEVAALEAVVLSAFQVFPVSPTRGNSWSVYTQ